MNQHNVQIFFYLIFIALFFCFGSEGKCADFKHTTSLIISVDVESGRGVDLPDQVNLVSRKGIKCGLQRLVEILDEKGYSATFFLNVYESKKWGTEPLEKLTKWLLKMGQDVQLHPHPHWAYDENRPYLYQYDLEEQIDIIRDGKAILEKWTGKTIVAHRAGAYSADRNTLEALIKNGIFLDSSFFWGNENSKITELDLGKNVVSQYRTIFEFPVTIYERLEHSWLLGDTQPISVIRKYDINWFRDPKEAEQALVAAIDNRLEYVMLFLHSFSFFEASGNDGDNKVDQNAIDTFHRVLDFVAQKKIKVMTFYDLSTDEVGLVRSLGRSDVIPEVKVEIGLIKYLYKTVLAEKAYIATIATGSIVLLSLGTLLTVRFRRNKTKV